MTIYFCTQTQRHNRHFHKHTELFSIMSACPLTLQGPRPLPSKRDFPLRHVQTCSLGIHEIGSLAFD